MRWVRVRAAGGERGGSRGRAAGHGQTLFVQCDVNDFQQLQHVVDVAVERFGRIDCLINNACGGLAACSAHQPAGSLPF